MYVLDRSRCWGSGGGGFGRRRIDVYQAEHRFISTELAVFFSFFFFAAKLWTFLCFPSFSEMRRAGCDECMIAGLRKGMCSF